MISKLPEDRFQYCLCAVSRMVCVFLYILRMGSGYLESDSHAIQRATRLEEVYGVSIELLRTLTP